MVHISSVLQAGAGETPRLASQRGAVLHPFETLRRRINKLESKVSGLQRWANEKDSKLESRLAMGHGPWAMGYGPWAMRYGPCAMGHGPSAMGPGPWAMGHEPWAMGPGPWALGRKATVVHNDN